MQILFYKINVNPFPHGWVKQIIKQAGTELGQAQLKLELELIFTWSKFCCIKLIDINTTGYFNCHKQVPTTKYK